MTLARTWTPYPYRRPPAHTLCAFLDEATGARWVGYVHDLPACDLRWVCWRITRLGMMEGGE